MTHTLAAPAPARPARRRTWWLPAIAFLVVATVAYLVYPYVPPTPSTSRVDVSDGTWHYVLLVAHIGCATIATLAGLAQFWPRLRARHPRVHRWTGRAYLFGGVFPAIILVAPLTATLPTGMANISGQYVLLGFWAITGIAGWRAARSRRYADHRKWMIRNYAATITALVTRPVGGIVAVIVVLHAESPTYNNDPVTITNDIAGAGIWLSMLLTLGYAEWYIYRTYGNGKRRHTTVTASSSPADSSSPRSTPAAATPPAVVSSATGHYPMPD